MIFTNTVYSLVFFLLSTGHIWEEGTLIEAQTDGPLAMSVGDCPD